jgi:hypothetical protein
MTLFLSSILGGSELMDKPFDQQSNAIVRNLTTLRPQMVRPGDASLQVIFEYPGKVSKPDFIGVQLGRYSKKLNMLLIRIAVGQDAMIANDFAQRYCDLLKGAIREGAAYFAKKKIEFSLEDHLSLAEKIVENV